MSSTMVAEREPGATYRRPEHPPASLEMPSVAAVLGVGFLAVASVAFIWALPDLIRYMRIRRM